MDNQFISQSFDGVKAPVICSAATINSILGESAQSRFNIPIYQRLYAWTPKEIEKMLDDFCDSLPFGRDYYIGNITLNLNPATKNFDIIDGQQRLTTLWLIGLVMSLTGQSAWHSFLSDQKGPSLTFTARPQDVRYLSDLLRLAGEDGLFTIPAHDINPGMRVAIKTITAYLQQLNRISITAFSDFIFKSVKFVAIFLERNSDLNKYFEDMNNRGLQLEPHHKIKADLLSSISDLRLLSAYAAVWDGVSQMNLYLENSLEGGAQDNRSLLLEPEHAFEAFIQTHKKSDQDEFLLESIMTQALNEKQQSKGIRTGIQNIDRAGSVLNFAEFFLHCLKLYLEDRNITVSLDDKHLLREYEDNKQYLEPRSFLRYLFRCRALFDTYIIKSINTGEVICWDILGIVALGNGDLVRETHFKSTLQLQSMLNVSVPPSFWFTPVLSCLLKEKPEESAFLSFLEKIDRKIYEHQKGAASFDNLLNEGTSTARYWFYKLDYLLWKRWTADPENIPSLTSVHNLQRRIKDFQFRDNRSVEHIEPRNPSYERWVTGQYAHLQPEGLRQKKDQFGNLALISISSNSAYSNYSPAEKKEDFVARSNKWGIESLKLVHIYSYPSWSIADMERHMQEMTDVFADYEREQLPE